MYVNEEEKKYAAYLTQELRMAGFIVETEYTGRGLKGQFKQADRLNAKYIAILNSEDLNNNEVHIKNNKTKEEDVISLDVLIYYLDEQLNTGDCDCGCDDEYCDCGHDHGCDCDESCDCGCQEGYECTCGDDEHDCGCGGDCHCHEEGHECHCGEDGHKCHCHE